MVKEVKAYLTTDGLIFVNELDAYKHECIFLQNIVNDNSSSKNNGFITCSKIPIKPIAVYNISGLKSHLEHPPHMPGIYMWFNTVTQKGYVGSAEDLFRRCSDFLRIESKYANEFFDDIRKNELDNFIYFILEYVKDTDFLIEKENYYINYYDTIQNGYNIRTASERPFKLKKCTDEEKKEKQRIKSAETAYSTIIKYIKEWGMKVGETLTLEKWIESYDLGGLYNFRLPCFIKNTNVVEFASLVKLGNTVKMFLDKPHYGYRTETDMFPSTMIRYRQSDKKYLAIGNDSRTFSSQIDAITYYIEEHIRIKLIGLLNKYKNDEVSEFIKNASLEDLIRLRYKDSEKIINFLSNKDVSQTQEELELVMAESAV